jgi:dynein heavy chain 1
VNAIRILFEEDGYVTKMLDYASTLNHVMEFTRIRCLEAMLALVRKGISNVIDFNDAHSDFPLNESSIETYM